MTFDEWWYKYGIEIDIPKNEACTIWMAALNNVEALKPSHNSRYVTALDVLQEYGGVTDVQYQDEHTFEAWLRERLHSAKAPNDA